MIINNEDVSIKKSHHHRKKHSMTTDIYHIKSKRHYKNHFPLPTAVDTGPNEFNTIFCTSL